MSGAFLEAIHMKSEASAQIHMQIFKRVSSSPQAVEFKWGWMSQSTQIAQVTSNPIRLQPSTAKL